MLLGNAGIIYGTRGKVFEGERDQSLDDFIETNFGVENVFQNKLVMGTCLSHEEGASETDTLLDNEEEANKFLSSTTSKKSRLILLYDKHGDSTNVKNSAKALNSGENVVVSRQQWDDLVSSLKKLEMSMKEGDGSKSQKTDMAHPDFLCDGRYPADRTRFSETYEARFKSLNCQNSELGSSCEGVEYKNLIHKVPHSSGKANHFISTARISAPVEKAMQATTKIISTDKRLVVDIGQDKKDLFSMFSTLESLDDIAHGYKMYKKWTTDLSDEKVGKVLKKASAKSLTDSRPHRLPHENNGSIKKGGKLKVEMSREVSKESGWEQESVLVFKIHNEQDTAVPGGMTLVCYQVENRGDELFSFNLPMGPHGIKPGNCEVLKFDWSSREAIKLSGFKKYSQVLRKVSRGLITLVDEQHAMKYRAFTRFRPGYSFALGPVPAEGYQGNLTVDLYREYNVMLFHIHNGLSLPILSGFSFECRENEDNHLNGSCQFEINEDILPGHGIVLRYAINGQQDKHYYTSGSGYGPLFTSKPRRGDLLIRDSDYDIKYKATSILQAGIHLILEPANGETVQIVGDLELFHETEKMHSSGGDYSDGPISVSTVTADDEISLSGSSVISYDSDWAL